MTATVTHIDRAKTLDTAKDYLWNLARMQQTLHPHGTPRSFEMLLLANGVACGPRINTDAPDMEPKACFLNAFNAVARGDHPGYVYCEGLAIGAQLGVPIHHGWLVHPATLQVIDRTPRWSSYEGTVYFGIPMQTDFVIESAIESGWPSPLFRQEMFNGDLWDLRTGDWVQALNREGGCAA